MAKRLQVYETPEITVTFEPALCIHSGTCAGRARLTSRW
jgi:uncharacterized Fe-S cluster protein YjdI